ncbi:MAG: peptidylprolyl isomerase [Gammaproteobacteria bacterium]|nr:peptidylprolyl isomerase [Gammaproteobacteria bacterium]
MRKLLQSCLLTSSLLIGLNAGTAQADIVATTDDNSPVLATVNGKPITQQMYSMYASKRNSGRPGTPPPSSETIINDMIKLEIVAQDAQAQGLDLRADVKTQLEWLKRTTLASISIQEFITHNPVTEADMKKAYDEQIANTGGEEYHARHILVSSKGDAEAIIKQLDEGADFAELAKEKSTGPTGKQGGDLGWFTADRMVKPFANALMKMKKGSYSKTPVETQFGQHIIYLEETRELSPPSYDQIKPRLQHMMQGQKVETYIHDLKEKATVVIK